jgi:hypothetical protein
MSSLEFLDLPSSFQGNGKQVTIILPFEFLANRPLTILLQNFLFRGQPYCTLLFNIPLHLFSSYEFFKLMATNFFFFLEYSAKLRTGLRLVPVAI